MLITEFFIKSNKKLNMYFYFVILKIYIYFLILLLYHTNLFNFFISILRSNENAKRILNKTERNYSVRY